MNKKNIRKIFSNLRMDMSLKNNAKYSKKITNIFLQNFVNLRNINIYLPNIENGEVNTWYIINKLYNQTNIYHPIIKNNKLSSIKHNGIYIRNKYGILEPYNTIENDNCEIYIIPMIVCDKKGNRLGYGKGYYDRYLKEKKGQFIGLSFYEPINYIENYNHDIKLHYCITPDDIIKF